MLAPASGCDDGEGLAMVTVVMMVMMGKRPMMARGLAMVRIMMLMVNMMIIMTMVKKDDDDDYCLLLVCMFCLFLLLYYLLLWLECVCVRGKGCTNGVYGELKSSINGY